MVDQGRAIEDVLRRVQRYWYEDGLAELAVGALFMLAAILIAAFGARTGAPTRRRWSRRDGERLP